MYILLVPFPFAFSNFAWNKGISNDTMREYIQLSDFVSFYSIETNNRSFDVFLSYIFFLFSLLFYLLMFFHRLYKYQDRRPINIEKLL